MGSLGAPELLIILILVLLVFGGAKLPKLARSLGQAQREFKTGLSEDEQSTAADPATGNRPDRPASTRNGSA